MSIAPDQPITPFPEPGRTFAAERLAELADCDPAGRVRLDSIARWLQDVALADVRDVGLDDDGVWIARRVRIEVDAWPRFGELVRIETACSGLGRLVAERRTRIRSAVGAVEAEALWVHLDPDNRMPARLDDRFAAHYAESADGRRSRSGLFHPGPPPGASAGEWRFRRCDLDLAGHVNNAAYWAIAEEELAGDPPPLSAEIEFRDGVGAGPASVLGSGAMRWVRGADGVLAASFLVVSRDA